MPIDRAKAMAATFPTGKASWGNDDVILYHLGVGAGVPATSPNELAYTYEKDLKVLPSFAVVVKFSPAGDVLSMPGLEFNPFMLLHGEQDVEVHNPLPPTAEGVTADEDRRRLRQGQNPCAILEIRAKDGAARRSSPIAWPLPPRRGRLRRAARTQNRQRRARAPRMA
jgi:hypothetical protein